MTGTNLVNYEEQLARDAEAYKQQEKIGEGRAITTRNGIFRIGSGDDALEVPGNQLCAVVLDAVWANVYYDARFDPDNALPPKCYAFGRNEAEMEAHLESMSADKSYFMPQNPRSVPINPADPNSAMRFASPCNGCPQAEWGTADTGKGKACANRRKLALLPAGQFTREGRDWVLDLYDDPRHFQNADIYTLSLPVTSVRGWSKYVQWLSANHNRPPYGAVTRIWIEPDTKHQFHVEFEFVELVDNALLPVIYPRHTDVVSNGLLVEGYQPPDPERQQAAASGTPRGGFRRR